MRDPRGAVTVEYVLLAGIVGLVLSGAFVAAGRTLVASYAQTRDALAAPFP
jgi:Flp pilus assembly pilin Flp